MIGKIIKVGLRKIRVRPQPFLNPLLGRIVGMWDLMRCLKKAQKGVVRLDYTWVQKARMEWNVFIWRMTQKENVRFLKLTLLRLRAWKMFVFRPLKTQSD